ncbi:uncharacterized protein [Palaemon carinicauda]|uniref:uncharacterized protein n=1 Tax=Palaemon carinicauda TaxID=392227 RepID=UPI0035B619A7
MFQYRGISLMAHAFKVYERIFEKRLRECIEPKLGEWQSGFRQGRGTSNKIFTLKMIFDKSWEWNTTRYIAFIDLEKAFDPVLRQNIWDALRDRYYGVPEKLTRAFYNTDQNIRFRQNPDENMTSDLIYAVVAETIEDLQQRMTDWNNILTSNAMKTRKEKTEIMLLSRTPADINISLEGHIGDRHSAYQFTASSVMPTIGPNSSVYAATVRILPFTNRDALAWFQRSKIPLCIKGMTLLSTTADYTLYPIPNNIFPELFIWLFEQRL